MNINNEPKWVDVDVEGEFTGVKYFGRFQLKPYLTHAERADVSRLAELYNRGITTDATQRAFMMTLAYLKFHIIETDAAWWVDGGLNLHDEAPVYRLAELVRQIQAPEKEKKDEEKPAAPEKKKKS